MTKTINQFGTVVPVEKYPEMEKLCIRYIAFCRSPNHQPTKWQEDFWKLCGHPRLGAISFDNQGALLLGIKEIILTDEKTGVRHRLGEYIVTIKRSPSRTISFESLTPIIESCHPVTNGEGKAVFHHPHILDDKLCINQGQHEMKLALVEGDLLEVFEYAIKILTTVDPHPFLALCYWPEAEEIIDEPEPAKTPRPLQSRLLSLPNPFNRGRRSRE